jgi:hypothetical protein
MDDFEFREDVGTEVVYGNGLVYGPPKTGKTTGLVTTAPGRVLYFNWDLKNATRRGRQIAKEQGRVVPSEPNMPRFKRDQTPVFDMMTQAVYQAYEGMWDTVISDHIVEHFRRLLEEQTNRARRPTLEARGNAWADIERWCRGMCEAPVNFVVVAHEMTLQKGDELLSIPFVGSQGASVGGVGTKLKSMVDFIAYTGVIGQEDEGLEFVAQLQPGQGRDGAQRDAGSRFDALMTETYRSLDLTEWFTAAGVHTGLPEKVETQSRNTKKATTRKASNV